MIFEWLEKQQKKRKQRNKKASKHYKKLSPHKKSEFLLRMMMYENTKYKLQSIPSLFLYVKWILFLSAYLALLAAINTELSLKLFVIFNPLLEKLVWVVIWCILIIYILDWIFLFVNRNKKLKLLKEFGFPVPKK